jgi:ABC-type transport system involved in multi-copper enzyme maturation permease subunit
MMMVLALIKNELLKLSRMKKLYVFFIISAAMTGITVYYFLQPGTGIMTVIETANAQALPLILKTSMTQFFGVFMAVYVADIISDEYKTGTLKLSMLRPVGRIKLLNSKVAAMFLFTVILMVFFVLSSYIIGAFAFGWADNMVFNGNTYSTVQGIMMTLVAYVTGLLPYMSFGMIAVFVAVLSKEMTTSIVITIGILMSGQYLYAIPSLKDYSIIVQMHMYHEYFIKTNNLSEAALIAIVCLAHIVVFYLLSIFAIKRKDILC